jgi:aminopeptidase-like protein
MTSKEEAFDKTIDQFKMIDWVHDLFPLNRSLTGKGTRDTLEYVKNLLPSLSIESVPTDTRVFDWTIPPEWNVTEAWIKDANGNKIVDFASCNLHLVGYSEPIHKVFDRTDLLEHLHSFPEQPDAIPYVTSYYQRTWGFCLAHREMLKLGDGPFEVFIDSSLSPGVMNYGELVIKGDSDLEILFSTYVCHPSMANNELSGPVVAIALAKWISGLDSRKYTYRFVFLPETIGSITYLSKNLKSLKNKLIAGWVLTCMGDEGAYSYVPSRNGNTLADRASLRILSTAVGEFKSYSWLDRGSDERQYCAPGVDLPIASVMRSKYGEYPEYHSSLDNLDFISALGLEQSLQVMQKIVDYLENRKVFISTNLCEPQLGKRGLYSTLSMRGSAISSLNLLNILSFCDGANDLLEISELCKLSISEVESVVSVLLDEGLIHEVLGSDSIQYKS